MTHSPGPWTEDNVQRENGTFVVVDKFSDAVAWVPSQPAAGEAEANAKLVAAAPDLLAAAEALLQANEGNPCTRDELAAFQRLSDVVQQAKGET